MWAKSLQLSLPLSINHIYNGKGKRGLDRKVLLLPIEVCNRIVSFEFIKILLHLSCLRELKWISKVLSELFILLPKKERHNTCIFNTKDSEKIVTT